MHYQDVRAPENKVQDPVGPQQCLYKRSSLLQQNLSTHPTASFSMSSLFLVTSASGNQGRAVVKELLAAGAKVRCWIRDPSKPEAKELEHLGAEVVGGDSTNADAVKAAVDGVKGIFVCTRHHTRIGDFN